ncbi:orotidine 5'-phosphate decarboxylase / HUMPS family protein [Aeropyrum camini]|uniref:Orotidine 5'-phosphate decarboxylase n=1 Tax=Aeropyrum camini SY1 = JCM 12091 TaxID=1198449 RepID=U3TFY0_9CREN|nr:orotidine 5'-phosphate decarboxylase / HUMPS family protein [Aeropyrum camini]BAN90945.1 orotidine 5'-phosphate decarboxylase [Aeropyrum camini SY1 = JCM 12091]
MSQGSAGLAVKRVIVALDPAVEGDVEKLLGIARLACREGAGIKVGLPMLALGGSEAVSEAARLCSGGGLRVLDLKLADIGYVMRLAVESLARGFDAAIAHAFIGSEGALEELKGALEGMGVRLVLVLSMSHQGSAEVIDPCLDRLISVATRVRPWGVVAPATRPGVIARVRSAMPRTVIMSPGVGAQGGRPGDAICLGGADYEIVGRVVTRSPDPVSALRSVAGSIAERCPERLLPAST